MGCDHAWVFQGVDLCRQAQSVLVSSCLVFPNALLTCLIPEDTAKQLSVIYVTLNISQGDPEVDLFQSQPGVLGGSHFRDSYLNAFIS